MKYQSNHTAKSPKLWKFGESTRFFCEIFKFNNFPCSAIFLFSSFVRKENFIVKLLHTLAWKLISFHYFPKIISLNFTNFDTFPRNFNNFRRVKLLTLWECERKNFNGVSLDENASHSASYRVTLRIFIFHGKIRTENSWFPRWWFLDENCVWKRL